MIAREVGPEPRLALWDDRLAAGHLDLALGENVPDGNRAVVTTEAQFRGTRRLARLGLERTAGVDLVRLQGTGMVPGAFAGSGAVRRVTKDAQLLLVGSTDCAAAAGGQVMRGVLDPVELPKGCRCRDSDNEGEAGKGVFRSLLRQIIKYLHAMIIRVRDPDAVILVDEDTGRQPELRRGVSFSAKVKKECTIGVEDLNDLEV